MARENRFVSEARTHNLHNTHTSLLYSHFMDYCMSNTLKKSLKRKKKLKSARSTKHKQEHENLLVVTPELIELGQALSGLSVAPLSTLLKPVRGLYRGFVA